MKLAHDTYSKGVLALKASILAPTLAMLKTALEKGYIITLNEDFKECFIILSAAVFIFGFDVLFDFTAYKLNRLEISNRLKSIKEEVSLLNECHKNDTDNKLKKKIDLKIRELKEEEVKLITK